MDNPRAFPGGGHYEEGMTLRDYFAARALSGLLVRSWEDASGRLPENIHAIWAKAAYATADAMLAERASTQSEDKNAR